MLLRVIWHGQLFKLSISDAIYPFKFTFSPTVPLIRTMNASLKSPLRTTRRVLFTIPPVNDYNTKQEKKHSSRMRIALWFRGCIVPSGGISYLPGYPTPGYPLNTLPPRYPTPWIPTPDTLPPGKDMGQGTRKGPGIRDTVHLPAPPPPAVKIL